MRFNFTTIYGLHTIGDRRGLWHELRLIQKDQAGPWLAMRDFNTVLNIEDRINGNQIHESEVKDFKNFMNDYHMAELRSIGAKYTWSNNSVSIKIDRGVSNTEWMLKYPHFDIIIMAPCFSDHSPLAIRLEDHQKKTYRPFRFFNVIAE
ncbi:uncharacterized protein LOC142161891 [Nicotiana tabacum]|uniref:Uncharacterized protein LOC142161891 n=1 Tax=Nicotiana tabacum TaxID=4097 RepID=A0AC58RMN8_TOBAC